MAGDGEFKQRVGTARQVYNGTAKQTSGGLTIDDLKDGTTKSRLKSEAATKNFKKTVLWARQTAAKELAVKERVPAREQSKRAFQMQTSKRGSTDYKTLLQHAANLCAQKGIKWNAYHYTEDDDGGIIADKAGGKDLLDRANVVLNKKYKSLKEQSR